MQKLIKAIYRFTGVQLKRYPGIDLRRRLKIINTAGIDLLLDVGANTGQFAIEMREAGYKGKIISFEPVKKCYEILNNRSLKDPMWEAYNFAVGEADKSGTINISQNYYSSSILKVLNLTTQAEPLTSQTETQEIIIKKLDTVFPELSIGYSNIMLKIDTQGYEKQILEGAAISLGRIKIIQLEMALVPLYDGEMLIPEMLKYLIDLGYDLWSLENGFYDKRTGRLLEVDGIFLKK